MVELEHEIILKIACKHCGSEIVTQKISSTTDLACCPVCDTKFPADTCREIFRLLKVLIKTGNSEAAVKYRLGSRIETGSAWLNLGTMRSLMLICRRCSTTLKLSTDHLEKMAVKEDHRCPICESSFNVAESFFSALWRLVDILGTCKELEMAISNKEVI